MTELQPKIILVEPSHPGNIGAAARAMKTMSLSRMVLVKPKQFPHPEAIARASRAQDILAAAQVCPSLAEALAGCHWVVGVTARPRKLSAPVYTPRQIMEKSNKEYAGLQIAWVFGRERTGLSNEELDLCHAICTIPANPDYSSLNLAAAVQIIGYERCGARQQSVDTIAHAENSELPENSMASADEVEGFYDHLWASLEPTGFMDETNPKPLMRKIRRIFDRTRLTGAEINILRGILKSLMKQ